MFKIVKDEVKPLLSCSGEMFYQGIEARFPIHSSPCQWYSLLLCFVRSRHLLQIKRPGSLGREAQMDTVTKVRDCCRKSAEDCLYNKRGGCMGHTPAVLLCILFGKVALVASIGLSSLSAVAQPPSRPELHRDLQSIVDAKVLRVAVTRFDSLRSTCAGVTGHSSVQRSKWRSKSHARSAACEIIEPRTCALLVNQNSPSVSSFLTTRSSTKSSAFRRPNLSLVRVNTRMALWIPSGLG